MSAKTAPRYAESIPAVTSPVKLPGLIPGRRAYLTGVITGGALMVLAVVLTILAMVLL